jgi:monoamine oxidase
VTTRIDLLDTLRDGLPATDVPRRHVVIVGAGMAGLTAGLLLKEAGHRVTILEARNRLGGRVYTYRGFAGRMYGEFGAMRFPAHHLLGQYLIKERFKLPTAAFPMYDEDTFVVLDGKKVRRSEFTAASFDYGLPENERGILPADLLKRAMEPLTTLIAEPDGWRRMIDQYDGESLLSFLISRGVSEQAISLMGPLLNLEGRYHFSLVEWFAHYHEDVFGHLSYIVDGSDTLPDAFSPALIADTRFGAVVHAIEQRPDGVTVRFKDPIGTEGVVTADEVVVTVPFVLLRHMEIDGLDLDKRFTMRNVYYGRAHKIFFQFSR